MPQKYKRIFYTICVFLFCIIDQRISSCSGEWQLILPNLLILILGAMTASRYSFRDFLKLPYAVWAGICFIAVPFAVLWGRNNTFYPGRWNSFLAILVLYGFLIIRILTALIREKRKPGMDLMLLAIYGAMLLLAGLSRYDYPWSVLMLAAFGVFFLTDTTQEDRGLYMTSLQDGIILAFFVLQGLALLVRPYDTLRYLGMYANTNMNALFYLSVYAAAFSRFCLAQTSHDSSGKWSAALLKWGYFTLSCILLSLVFYTMSRSAMVGMAAVTALGILYCLRHKAAKGSRILAGIRYCLLLGLITGLCLPAVYLAIRYIPPIFHHPVWFFDEYSEEKVHSWDEYDSPKYTDWRDVVQGNLGRFSSLLGMGQNKDTWREGYDPKGAEQTAAPGSEQDMGGFTPSPEGSRENDREDIISPDDSFPQESDSGSEAPYPGDSEDGLNASGNGSPASADGGSPMPPLIAESGNSGEYRLHIYQYYLSRLNLTGHTQSEHGLQVTEGYYAPHAHNLLLQFCFNYGLLAGLLFCAFLGISGIRMLMNAFRRDTLPQALTVLLLFAGPVLFGMTEIMWRDGHLAYSLILLMPYFACPLKKPAQ